MTWSLYRVQILSLNGKQYNIINLIICLLFGIFWMLLEKKRCEFIANSIHWIICRIVNHVFPWNYLTYCMYHFFTAIWKNNSKWNSLPSKIGWFHGIFLNVRNFYTVPLCTLYVRCTSRNTRKYLPQKTQKLRETNLHCTIN